MAYTKKRHTFDPDAKRPYRLSRYRIDIFLRCPRCFYLSERMGVERPSFPAFTLNSAVDQLFKKEFDIHRTKNEPHPLMKTYGINAVPFSHPKMDEWRNNFKGVRTLHEPTNFLVFGAVDDIWVTPNKVLAVVDYKSTSTSRKIDLDSKWKKYYKKQVEVYQWLLGRQKDLKEKGYRVSDKSFFVYANGRKDKKAFDGKLEFDVQIIPYLGDSSWVEPTLKEARALLEKDEIPAPAPDCEYCAYRKEAERIEQWKK